MSMIARELREVWDALRGSNALRDEALTAVRIRRLRGISDLRLGFHYPVSVLAGPNGCGKSTLLSACACAYRVPGRDSRSFTPGRLFPDFASRLQEVPSDAALETEIECHYLHRGERLSMAWRRQRSWKRSLRGSKGLGQPERQVYLRTLANASNPSELRGALQLGRRQVESETLSPELLSFAHGILPWKYRRLALISGPASDLLLAEIEDGAQTRYSEYHMSSGERAILRISKDVARLQSALVLIDDIDAGLHPHTQRQAMLELQRSALRQELQVVVASHSPVVLDSVPPEARLFLERDDETGDVRCAPLYHDILQKTLYGQSQDQLSILCEDVVGEGVIRGVVDVLTVELDLLHGDVVVIGRNTGRNEFPAHVRTLTRFDKLSSFILVLRGDSGALEDRLREIAKAKGHAVQVAGSAGRRSAGGMAVEDPAQASRRLRGPAGLDRGRPAEVDAGPGTPVRGSRAATRRRQGHHRGAGPPPRTHRPRPRPDRRPAGGGKASDPRVGGRAEGAHRGLAARLALGGLAFVSPAVCRVERRAPTWSAGRPRGRRPFRLSFRPRMITT